VISLKNMDACLVIKNPNHFQKEVVNKWKFMYPKIVHNCPYNEGEKFELNYTHTDENCPLTDAKNSAIKKPYFFPDGDYRVEISTYAGEHEIGRINYWWRDKTGDEKRF
jgi:hypothetical protein